MFSCCCCTSAFGILLYAMMITDHHGIENGILFFLTPSRYSSLQRRKYSIFTVTTCLSPSLFTDQKPKKVLLNTNIEKHRFSQHTAPTDSSMTLAGQAAHKQRCGFCTYELPASFPPFLKTPTRTVFHPPFSIPTTSCSQPQGCTSRALPPSQARAGTSKASSLNTKRNVLLPLLRSAGITDRKGKVDLSLLD